jgi:hypothetical protein
LADQKREYLAMEDKCNQLLIENIKWKTLANDRRESQAVEVESKSKDLQNRKTSNEQTIDNDDLRLKVREQGMKEIVGGDETILRWLKKARGNEKDVVELLRDLKII